MNESNIRMVQLRIYHNVSVCMCERYMMHTARHPCGGYGNTSLGCLVM